MQLSNVGTVSDTHPNPRGIPRAPLPSEGPTARTPIARHTRAGRAARRRPWIAFALAVATLVVALWIVVPAPTRLLLPLSVGAPEISIWLVLAAIIAGVGSVRTWRAHRAAKAALVASVLALLLACWPLVQFPSTSARAVGTLRTSLGEDYLDAVPIDRQLRLRVSPLFFADLFRGLPLESAVITKRVVFATVEKVPLAALVYQPSVAGRYPVIVQIYGGAWQRGSPDDYAEFARFFAARGYVVFAIDYRHAPQFRFLQQVADVKVALAWVRRTAAVYGGDASRIALIGRSAGAHLAMMEAYDSSARPVQAVVNFYGPVDLVESYLHPPRPDPLDVRDVETTFIGASLDSARALYERASPINLVRGGLPPTLSLYGARDNIVERKYGALLDTRLRATGNTSVFVEIPWADHAFDEVSNGLSGQLSRYVTERFLAWALTRQDR